MHLLLFYTTSIKKCCPPPNDARGRVTWDYNMKIFFLRFRFLVLAVGGHLLRSAQIDGDAFVLRLLIAHRLAELLEGRRQGDRQGPRALAAVADVGVALERRRGAAHQGRRRDGRVADDDHRENSRVNHVLILYSTWNHVFF